MTSSTYEENNKAIENLFASITTWNMVDQPADVVDFVADAKKRMNEKVHELEIQKQEVIKSHLQEVLDVLKHEHRTTA